MIGISKLQPKGEKRPESVGKNGFYILRLLKKKKKKL